MRRFPRGYGGERRNPEQVKRDGWKEQRVFAVSLDDQRLTWPERNRGKTPGGVRVEGATD